MEPIPQESIEKKIHTIRDKEVMLDKDLATLYEVTTKVLNQAVKRNLIRFPEDFMFQLSKEECSRSRIVILKSGVQFKVRRVYETSNGLDYYKRGCLI